MDRTPVAALVRAGEVERAANPRASRADRTGLDDPRAVWRQPGRLYRPVVRSGRVALARSRGRTDRARHLHGAPALQPRDVQGADTQAAQAALHPSRIWR